MNLKQDLFFLSKLYKEGYSLPYYIRFIKNRLFANHFINKVKVYEYEPEDFELHMLSSQNDLWILVCSISSLLNHSDLRPKIVIHDDGSIRDKSIQILESKFKNLKVIPRKIADASVNNMKMGPNLARYRNKGHNLILKLVDSILLSSTEKIMVMDSDILFFNEPKEIVNFIRDNSEYDGVVAGQWGPYISNISENYIKKYDLIEKGALFINGGLQVFNKNKITSEDLDYFFGSCEVPPEHYFAEANGWVALLGKMNFKMLDRDKYKIKGKPDSKTIAKHFTGPRRHELYAYGIDMALKGFKI